MTGHLANRAGECRRQIETAKGIHMSRQRKTPTPLDVIVSTRVPETVANEWRAAANAKGLSFSDWLRQAVDGERIKLSRKPTPRKRPAPVAPSGADPILLGQLVAIGNAIYEIARAAKARVAAGAPFLVIELLIMLSVIERHLHTLAATASNHVPEIPKT